jgi:hypothetical protein
MPPLIEVPLPVIFNVLPFGNLGKGIVLSMAEAARRIGSLMYVTPESYGAYLKPFKAQLIPLLPAEGFDVNAEIFDGVKMAELFYAPDVRQRVQELKDRYPQLVVSVRLPINPEARTIAADLAAAGAEVIHLFADYRGNEFVEGDSPRFVKDALRNIHTHLVNASVRDQVTLIVSGGIALAEHLPKVIICGADGVAVDLPLLIALECRVCKRCVAGKSCPVELQNIDPEYGSQRLVNLMCSWWSQLIELMGAMGIRDVRRVRGEAGRAMFFEDMERDTFGALFSNR